jgi:hypothetical protein
MGWREYSTYRACTLHVVQIGWPTHLSLVPPCMNCTEYVVHCTYALGLVRALCIYTCNTAVMFLWVWPREETKMLWGTGAVNVFSLQHAVSRAAGDKSMYHGRSNISPSRASKGAGSQHCSPTFYLQILSTQPDVHCLLRERETSISSTCGHIAALVRPTFGS